MSQLLLVSLSNYAMKFVRCLVETSTRTTIGVLMFIKELISQNLPKKIINPQPYFLLPFFRLNRKGHIKLILLFIVLLVTVYLAQRNPFQTSPLHSNSGSSNVIIFNKNRLLCRRNNRSPLYYYGKEQFFFFSSDDDRLSLFYNNRVFLPILSQEEDGAIKLSAILENRSAYQARFQEWTRYEMKGSYAVEFRARAFAVPPYTKIISLDPNMSHIKGILQSNHAKIHTATRFDKIYISTPNEDDSNVINHHIYDHELRSFTTHPIPSQANFQSWILNDSALLFTQYGDEGLLGMMIYDEATKTASLIPETGEVVPCRRAFSWSEQGQKLVFEEDREEATSIVLYDLQRQLFHKVTESQDGNEYQPAFHPSGDQVAYIEDSGNGMIRRPSAEQETHRVIVIDLHSGEKKLIANDADSTFASPQWSFDGRYLAYLSRNPTTRKEFIVIYDMNRDEQVEFLIR